MTKMGKDNRHTTELQYTAHCQMNPNDIIMAEFNVIRAMEQWEYSKSMAVGHVPALICMARS